MKLLIEDFFSLNSFYFHPDPYSIFTLSFIVGNVFVFYISLVSLKMLHRFYLKKIMYQATNENNKFTIGSGGIYDGFSLIAIYTASTYIIYITKTILAFYQDNTKKSEWYHFGVINIYFHRILILTLLIHFFSLFFILLYFLREVLVSLIGII